MTHIFRREAIFGRQLIGQLSPAAQNDGTHGGIDCLVNIKVFDLRSYPIQIFGTEHLVVRLRISELGLPSRGRLVGLRRLVPGTWRGLDRSGSRPGIARRWPLALLILAQRDRAISCLIQQLFTRQNSIARAEPQTYGRGED
jgi:hypothetical protein